MLERFRRLAIAVALTGSAMGGLLIAPAGASATAPTRFDCGPVFYQLSDGWLWRFEPVTATYAKVDANLRQSGINAGGYNPADDYVYGLVSSTLHRVGLNGAFAVATPSGGFRNSAGVPVTPKTTAADFIAPNLLLTSASDDFTLLNITTGLVSSFSISGWGVADFTYQASSNRVYGFSGQTVRSFDVSALIANGAGHDYSGTTFTVDTRTMVYDSSEQTAYGLASSGYGSAYSDSSGGIYFYQNASSQQPTNRANLWRLSPSEVPTSEATPEVTLIKAMGSDAVTNPTLVTPNDGMSCPTAPDPFAPPVTANDDVAFALGGSVDLDTPATSPLADDVSGSPLSFHEVTFCGQTITNPLTTPESPASITCSSGPSSGAVLTVNSWTNGYVSLTGLPGSAAFTYRARERVAVFTENAPRTTGAATVTVQALLLDANAGGAQGLTLAQGDEGQAYGGHGFSAQGKTGSQTYHWGATGLPPGMSVDANGQLVGTPTAPGTYAIAVKVSLESTLATFVTRTFGLVVAAAGSSAPPPTTYAVAYDANCPSSCGTAPAGGTYTAGGSALVVAGPGGLQRSGYEFVGWNTAADGSGTAYPAGSSYAVAASATLYAQWRTVASTRASVVTVTLDPRGGQVSVTTLLHVPGDPGLDLPTARKAGQRFVGWSPSGRRADAVTTPYVPARDATLYAVYEPAVALRRPVDVVAEVRLSRGGLVVDAACRDRRGSTLVRCRVVVTTSPTALGRDRGTGRVVIGRATTTLDAGGRRIPMSVRLSDEAARAVAAGRVLPVTMRVIATSADGASARRTVAAELRASGSTGADAVTG